MLGIRELAAMDERRSAEWWLVVLVLPAVVPLALMVLLGFVIACVVDALAELPWQRRRLARLQEANRRRLLRRLARHVPDTALTRAAPPAPADSDRGLARCAPTAPPPASD
jgi:hypothetical protein